FIIFVKIIFTMVNSGDFIKRLEKILHYYDISASAFADKINVQRSSISHLLTGRNKPSLEFVLKVIQTFPEVNLYWFLKGKGTFPHEPTENLPPPQVGKEAQDHPPKTSKKSIKKIIIFYEDGSFEPYES
ncbi:MAG: helix-turn-helix transcriptional regulator, partial [Bacteroidota bacterium]